MNIYEELITAEEKTLATNYDIWNNAENISERHDRHGYSSDEFGLEKYS